MLWDRRAELRWYADVLRPRGQGEREAVTFMTVPGVGGLLGSPW